MSEVIKLTGLCRWTLRYWIRKGHVVPIHRGGMGRTHTHTFSAWQTIGLTILGAAVRSVRDRHTYVGSTGVKRAMEALSELSDELLLAEECQDMRVAETVAATIARESLTSDEDPVLSPQILEGVARVVAALDRKVGAIRARAGNRLK